MSRLILLLSGGIDSVACLYKAVEDPSNEVFPFFVRYGQGQAIAEQTAAQRHCDLLGVPLRTHEVAPLLGTAEGAAVPARNLILISLAANYAQTVAATELWAGILPGGTRAPKPPQLEFGQPVWFAADGTDDQLEPRKGLFIRRDNIVCTVVDEQGFIYEVTPDHVYRSKTTCAAGIKREQARPENLYSDCTAEFINATNLVLKSAVSSDWQLKLVAPFYDKVSVIRYAKRRGIDVNSTWSCLQSRVLPCGECKACIDRDAAQLIVGA